MQRVFQGDGKRGRDQPKGFCNDAIKEREKMTIKDDEWGALASKMGYEDEQHMWDAEYKTSSQGAKTIRLKMQRLDPFAPSALAIRMRLRKLGYKIKGQGGPNHRGKIYHKLSNTAHSAR